VRVRLKHGSQGEKTGAPLHDVLEKKELAMISENCPKIYTIEIKTVSLSPLDTVMKKKGK
jgi:hypothetical protein